MLLLIAKSKAGNGREGTETEAIERVLSLCSATSGD